MEKRKKSTWYKQAAYQPGVNAPNVPAFVPDGSFNNTPTGWSNVRTCEEFQRTAGGTPMQGCLANESLDSLPPLAKKTRHAVWQQDNSSCNSGEGSFPQEPMSCISVHDDVSESSLDHNSGTCLSHEVQNMLTHYIQIILFRVDLGTLERQGIQMKKTPTCNHQNKLHIWNQMRSTL